MKRRIMTAMLIVAAATAICFPAFAAETDKVDVKGISFKIPEEIRDLITVKLDNPDPDTLVSVYETASVEAAKAQGEDGDGAGFIFSISTMPESRLKELRCGAMDGMEVFAENDDIYYVYNHPTDVRFVRESYDDVDEDMAQYTKIGEWAWQEVRQEILANNSELDEEFYTNTLLDMYLARAAYKSGTKFELRSLEYGPDPLDPSTLDDDDYIEDLAEEATYEILPDATAPDGQYYVLAFDDDGEEVRYDFFMDPYSQNLIREVRTIGGEEYELFYQANFKDADDDDETTTGIMEDWCRAVAQQR